MNRSRWAWLALSLIFWIGIGTWGIRHWRKVLEHPTVVLVDPEVDGTAGLGETYRYALGTLVQDFLETSTGSPIFRMPYAPTEDSLARGGKGRVLVLRLRASREQERLGWTLRWAWMSDLKEGAAYRESSSPYLPPREAFRWLAEALPIGAHPEALAALVPEEAPPFWRLMEAMALGNDAQKMSEAMGALRALSQELPDCAAVRVHLGMLAYFRMNGTAGDSREDQSLAQSELEAALRLVPFLPRGVQFLSRLRTDFGSAREALELLRASRRARPRDLTILGAILYPARYAGLIPLALAAEERMRQQSPPGARPPRLAFHLLYAGRWDDYESTLWEWPGDPRNAACRYYRGELALMRGNPERALALFREVEQMSAGHRQFRVLASVHRATLEGRREEASRLLRDYQRERAGLRSPDGEITLILAGCFMNLGEEAEAMGLARQAFSQGFSCLAWYERNPFLAPLRRRSQWSWLMQHVTERQALLESKNVLSDFGL